MSDPGAPIPPCECDGGSLCRNWSEPTVIDAVHPSWREVWTGGDVYSQRVQMFGREFCVSVHMILSPDGLDVMLFGLRPRLYGAARLQVETQHLLKNYRWSRDVCKWFELPLGRALDLLANGREHLMGQVSECVLVTYQTIPA